MTGSTRWPFRLRGTVGVCEDEAPFMLGGTTEVGALAAAEAQVNTGDAVALAAVDFVVALVIACGAEGRGAKSWIVSIGTLDS